MNRKDTNRKEPKLTVILAMREEQNSRRLEEAFSEDIQVFVRKSSCNLYADAVQKDLSLLAPAGRLLVLTDRKDLCKQALEEGICCIGIETEECTDELTDAFAVMTEPLEIDETWLEMQYCHFHGEPFVLDQQDQWRIRESIPGDFPKIRDMVERTGLLLFSGEGDSPESQITEEAFQALTEKSYRMWGFGLWTIEKEGQEKGGRSREVIGWCGLYPSPLSQGGAELGYVIAPEYQRQGIGFDVCKKILHYAQEHLDIDVIRLRTDRRNQAGMALARKLGFHQTGDGSLVEIEWYRTVS